MTDSIPPQLAAAWAARGLTADDLIARTDGTLDADRRFWFEATFRAEEGPLDHHAARASSEDFEPTQELGRGGMGVVFLAEQPSLRRRVALKCLTETSANAVSSLLKEAWVAGALDHPNIVPVHTVVAMNGAPAIAMKRIEGVSWADLIEDPSRHPRPTALSPETRHLNVFLQVCDAVHFAHRRGILHLDLKPDNVMIGAFGEVYVVDWGLAAGIETYPEWLMPAASIDWIAGSPAYMPPEIAAASGPDVGRHTDVYLLGATLHHALLGEPLHDAPTLVGILHRAILSEPYDYRSAVHPELARILRCACHMDPACRFETVDLLRIAVEDYLRHGESNRLASEAQVSLAALRRMPAHEASLREHELRCRLLLEQAESTWGDNPQALETRAELVEELLRKALEREELPVAEQLFRELHRDNESLGTELAELRRRHHAEVERVDRLDALHGELDVGRALTERRQLFFALGLLWLTVNLALGYVNRTGVWPIGYPELLGEGVVIGLFFAPYAFIQRRIFFQNIVNARLQRILILTAVATELLFIAGWLTELPVGAVLALSPLLYGFGFAAVAATVDGRLVIGAAFQWVAFVLVGFLPTWLFEILGISGLLSAATTWKWPEPGADPR